MIAEEIKSKSNGKSVRKLIDYIIDKDNDGGKVAFVNITNCISTDIDLAMMEISLTQDKNTRTKKDKTFHMVVSFPPGETPTREQLEDIEQVLAESVGMGHHQRVSAAHTNTACFHLHVVINKVDPNTYKFINNYFYHKEMMKSCTELEIKHGLQQIERKSERTLSVNNMDYFSGQNSFNVWCQENIKEKLESAIQSASSWDDIHDVFSGAGLVLSKSGCGLVVQDKESDIRIKATSVSRFLSIHRIENTLGSFKETINRKSKTSAYVKNKDKDFLFTKYKKIREEQQQLKRDALARLKYTVEQQRLLAKADNCIKRHKTKISGKSATHKRTIYKRLAENNRRHLAVITRSYAHARKRVYEEYRSITFQQYLCLEATNGNEEALSRVRSGAQKLFSHQGLTGEGNKRITKFDAIQVDKHGVILYQIGRCIILDNGNSLTCNENDLSSVKSLLEVAVEKYGRKLTVNGSDEFKSRIFSAAESLKMDIELNGQNIVVPDPIEQFIANRNVNRVQNKHILHHERLEKQSGTFIYQGYRNVAQHSVVLLKKGITMYVNPIPKATLSEFRRLKVGALVVVPPEQNRTIQKHEIAGGHDMDN